MLIIGNATAERKTTIQITLHCGNTTSTSSQLHLIIILIHHHHHLHLPSQWVWFKAIFGFDLRKRALLVSAFARALSSLPPSFSLSLCVPHYQLVQRLARKAPKSTVEHDTAQHIRAGQTRARHISFLLCSLLISPSLVPPCCSSPSPSPS